MLILSEKKKEGFLTITIWRANSESAFATIKRFDGVAPAMKTVGIAAGKLDELSRPYLIQATFCNASLGGVEVYLANEFDANLFLSVFEDFEE